MANLEHLRILIQGHKAWNKWRNENPNIEPDLSGWDLRPVNLWRKNLRRVNLRDAYLHGLSLPHARLAQADLSGADVTRTDLSRAHLSKANISKADLSEAMLSYANLSGANLAEANLLRADLRGANLTKVCLKRATVVQADLFEADLIEANLSEAVLSSANFYWANLEKADLRNADLSGCRLVRTNLTGAVLTGTKLYGTSRDDWIIKNVQCTYVYWDWEGKRRSPKDRDLEPGEFERLYAALPTIEYAFENGMSPLDPLIMDRVVEAIREGRPEFDIKIDSINARGLAPSIKFTVQHEEHKEPALEEVRKVYEVKLQQLESERERYWEVIKSAFDKPREFKLISAGPGAIVATDGSTINIQPHIHNALELQKAIAAEPDGSESFVKVAKKTALDIIGGATKDIAKGQVKEAAKQVVELGKDLGPIIAKTAAYAFFKGML